MQQKKIVILENNHDTAQAVAESLRGEGFEVCGATDDGSEGVALIERTKPDVVLVGLVLKGLDGFGVMDAFIRAIETNDCSHILSGVDETLESHLMVFAAEESRLTGKVVDIR